MMDCVAAWVPENTTANIIKMFPVMLSNKFEKTLTPKLLLKRTVYAETFSFKLFSKRSSPTNHKTPVNC
jgi:hypothetical protein